MRFLLLLLLCCCIDPARAQAFISRQGAIEDLDETLKVMEEVHYDPYRYITRARLLQNIDSLKHSLPDSIHVTEFLGQLFSLTALLQDGHTMPAISQPVLGAEQKKQQFLPFSYLTDENGHVFVRATSIPEMPTGVRLLSVNGVPVEEAKKKAAGFIGGLQAWKTQLSDRLFSYFLYLQQVRPPFRIRYEDKQQKHREIILQNGSDLRTSLTLSLPGLQLPKYAYEVRNEKLGYINFVSMTGDYDSFFRFLDSAFRDMRAKDIRHLAIDLRHNTGGNSRFGDILLAYITDQKFALSGKKKWKVSRRYKAHLLSGGDSSSVYHKQRDGSIWEIGECGPRERLVRQDTIYNGKVYFLTGALTFSSANMLADGAKQYKLATLVGEPTGESTNDFGEAYTFALPNSRLQITTTTSFDIGADCDETHNNAVAPDISIKQSVQHLLDGRDLVLEYVMKQASMLQSSASRPTPGAKKSLP